MFGFFKKKASSSELGQIVIHYSKDFLNIDSINSIRRVYIDIDEDIDNPIHYLESKGILKEIQQLYFRTYAHCTMQAISTNLVKPKAREFVSGAMSLFTNQLDLYDFDDIYDRLDKSFHGHRIFDPRVEALDDICDRERQAPFLPPEMKYAGLSNAKLLLNDVIIKYTNDADIFFDQFNSFHSVVNASIGTSQRALNQASKSFKM